MIQETTLPNGVVISDDRARLDMNFIHGALAEAYWALGRPAALTERSIAHCLCFGVYTPAGLQIGFARLLTDYTFRAHVSDVIIAPTARGQGLGKALLEKILAHPELTTVTQWTLVTADAHGLYAQFGFQSGGSDETWMQMTRKRG